MKTNMKAKGFCHQESHTLPYAAEDLFNVVIAIDHYPHFLPWAVKARTYHHQGDHFLADLTIGYGPFTETYTSKVTYEGKENICATHVKGPFKHLTTRWSFVPISEKETHVTFHIAFELKSLLFQAMLEKIFEKACKTFFKAFENRCHTLYGEKNGAGEGI